MKAAAAYIRVSTDEQVEFSPAAQLRALKAWAASNGYLIDPDHVYVDEGISGRKAERRPAFMAMIGAAKQKPAPFEVILVHKFDRFARSREDSVVYKSLLRKECGVRVISITESIEDDKFSVIMEAMLEAMAEYYSINLAEEVRKGMTEKARRGQRQSHAPYGYRMVNHELIPDPDEADIVREIYRRFTTGGTYRSIVYWLNSSGIRTRQGKPFTVRNVRYILTNPTYIGLNAWTPSRGKRRNSEYYMTPETVVAQGTHEPIIDRETWDAAQLRVAELREQYGHDRRPAAHADWISGLVRCSECGRPMSRQPYRKTSVRWVCSGYTHGACPTPNSIVDDQFKAYFVEAVRVASRDQSGLLEAARRAAQSRPANPYPKMLAALDARLARAQDAYQRGIDTIDEYAAAKRTINAERESILARMAAESASSESELAAAASRYASDLAALADLLASDADMQTKHDAAHAIISYAIWDKSEPSLSIVYNADHCNN